MPQGNLRSGELEAAHSNLPRNRDDNCMNKRDVEEELTQGFRTCPSALLPMLDARQPSLAYCALNQKLTDHVL